MCSDDKKNLSPQQTKKPPPNKTMWFQTMLLATLSLAEYGKYFLSSLGRCNRSLRLHRPDNLYVRVNSIEGMWLAAFLQKQRLANRVTIVEETEKEIPASDIDEEDFLTLDAAFRSVGVDIEWEPAPIAKKPVEKEKDWALFTSADQTKEKEEEVDESKLRPEDGWKQINQAFKDQLWTVEHLPEQELMYVIDAREDDESADFASTLRQALRIIGVLNIEIDMLSMQYMFEAMVPQAEQIPEVETSEDPEEEDITHEKKEEEQVEEEKAEI